MTNNDVVHWSRGVLSQATAVGHQSWIVPFKDGLIDGNMMEKSHDNVSGNKRSLLHVKSFSNSSIADQLDSSMNPTQIGGQDTVTKLDVLSTISSRVLTQSQAVKPVDLVSWLCEYRSW